MKINRYYVYQHRFSNGAIYIGKGCGNRINDKRRNQYYNNALNKYGEPIKGIMKDNLTSAEAFKIERYIIQNYHKQGYTLYNLKDGGDGNPGHAEETKKLISLKSKQAWQKPGYKEKMSNLHKGQKPTKEQIEKIKKALTGVPCPARAQPGLTNSYSKAANIYCYKTNKLVAENICISEWAKQNNCTRENL